MAASRASWADPRTLVALAGVVACGVLAFGLDVTGSFSPLLFGLGVLGVFGISALAVAASDQR
ncbi:hypothetical protein [Halomarina rubra]|uniref:Major facilitator superfamily (MFS) profile domain-containing protein n=1 Tax=Halomarina rubra TaxID=2071873 RepID=A0ABD6AP97_9EURY|nr:hypothetical protein [Halomarina rubra]